MVSFFRYGALLLLTSGWGFCFSQPDTVSRERMSTNIKAGYNSSFIYPGARLGLESPVSRIILARNPGSEMEKIIVKDQFLTSNVSFYHHPGFHDNLYITLGWLKRRTKPKGFFTEFSPEIGYSRTFLGGTTYKVSDSGVVTVEKLAGYSYALVSAGEGLGYDFKTKPFLVFARMNLLCMFPYNSTIYFRPALETGLIYRPSDFLKMSVKTRKLK